MGDIGDIWGARPPIGTTESKMRVLVRKSLQLFGDILKIDLSIDNLVTIDPLFQLFSECYKEIDYRLTECADDA